MWLLPIVFMIHEFEQIIMMKPWAAKNANEIQRRLVLHLRLAFLELV
jgi:hypothetical protein